MKTNKIIILLLVAGVLFSIALFPVFSFADKYIIRQLTDNDYENITPSMYNGQIAWVEKEDVHTYGGNIVYWNGTSTTRITSSSTAYTPSLYDGKIAYMMEDRSMYTKDIYYWDGTNTTKLSDTSSNYEAEAPSLYNGEIAWQEYTDEGTNIYYWNGTTITKITGNMVNNWYPSLYNGQIAWVGYEYGDSDIYYWNGANTTRISNSSGNDIQPSLYNGAIAWQGTPDAGEGYKIMYWDGSSVTRMTDNTLSSSSASLYNGQIAWGSIAGMDNDQIYYWNGSSITLMADGFGFDINSKFVSLYDGALAWSMNVAGVSSEIFYAQLASDYIANSLPAVAITYFTEQEIMDLSDMYSNQSSGVVHGMDWTYLSGDLPGDTNGEIYEIGDSWYYEGNYYIKLGSGLQGTGTVPELPGHFALGLFPAGILLSRVRKRIFFMKDHK